MRSVLGGGGPQAAFGARIWSDSVGFLSRSGSDLADAQVEVLRGLDIDLTGWRQFPDIPTPRTLMHAAGLGTRLGGTRPKLLVPVGGIPMIDRLLALFAGTVDRAVVVVHPSFEREVREHLARPVVPVTTVVQRLPTGMLDAIMLAEPAVRSTAPDEVWIAGAIKSPSIPSRFNDWRS